MGCQHAKPKAEQRPSIPVGSSSDRLRCRAYRLADQLWANPTVAPELRAMGLSRQDLARRATKTCEVESLELGTKDQPVRVQYAYWSQRGFYPEESDKPNQDDCDVHACFAGETHDACFVVFDGHGKHGHDCAAYAAQHLPAQMTKHIKQTRATAYKKILKEEAGREGSAKKFTYDPEHWPTLSNEDYESCCRQAFLECNAKMNKTKEVESNMSGTTAVAVAFHQNIMTVCNVGDSRVVLGTVTTGAQECQKKGSITPPPPPDHDGSAAATPDDPVMNVRALSCDQTPYRRDERERIQQAGGSIMSMDSLGRKTNIFQEDWGDRTCDDNDLPPELGDPPRVFLRGQGYPGTAFTRSLGDSVAETVGVFADPEIQSRQLQSGDQVLVLASDGIFEFLSNKTVIRISYEADDPLQACEQLVAAAYEQWLEYESRTDDITVIVCFLEVT